MVSLPGHGFSLDRRLFVRLGALALGGWASSRQQVRGLGSAPRTAVIQVVLAGGFPPMETFDPKPDAPAEVRGAFGAIATKIPGCSVSELFPEFARSIDKYSILRAVNHKTDSHNPGRHWMLTGYPPGSQAEHNVYPSSGAVAARYRGGPRGLPAYVWMPGAHNFGGAAYLGSGYNPFEVDDPNVQGFSVRNLALPKGIAPVHLDSRRDLLRQMDTLRRDLDSSGVMAGMDAFTRDAFEVIASPACRHALDIDRENHRLRERYGRNTLGQSLLLARRLVEAGVAFVTVQDGGWDMHEQIKEKMDAKGPVLDRALSALAEDLAARGLFERVLVVVLGEFGRTPKINDKGGRDHWGKVFTVLLGGGGVQGGRVIGASSERGEAPRERPVAPEELLATMYYVLGIDPSQTPLNAGGRPIPLLPGGAPIRELF